MNVTLQIVQLKLHYLYYCCRYSTAASNTAVPPGLHPISEAAEVIVELRGKFSATREKTTDCRYGNVLYRNELERLLFFNKELLGCCLLVVFLILKKCKNLFA
jgi:hypothetical protein